MSYPPARYSGDEGLSNATFRPSGAEPDLSYGLVGQVHYLATGASTAGGFGLYAWEMGPAPSGPTPHFHKTISESFYILSGAVRLYDGRRWMTATSGDFLYVPQGGIHAFRNDSGERASMLLLFTPGAPREDYFETLKRLGEGLVLSEEERQAFFLRHDTYWVDEQGA
ncbi:MAG: cupin domain-containing protein [Egibacteraceae bacterium]